MHALRRSGDEAANGRGRRRGLGIGRRRGRHIEAELVDDLTDLRLAGLGEPPFDRSVQRAGERDESATALWLVTLGAGLDRSPRRALGVLTWRIGSVLHVVGDGDAGDDLAGRGDAAAFARRLVATGGGIARRARAEIGRCLGRLVVADDLALEIGGDDDDVRALQRRSVRGRPRRHST